MREINMNDDVWVKLTQKGWNLINTTYQSYFPMNSQEMINKHFQVVSVGDEKFIKVQLAIFISVFGRFMPFVSGEFPYIENLNIYITDPTKE